VPYHRLDQLVGFEVEETNLAIFSTSHHHVVYVVYLDFIDLRHGKNVLASTLFFVFVGQISNLTDLLPSLAVKKRHNTFPVAYCKLRVAWQPARACGRREMAKLSMFPEPAQQVVRWI
jgi:hypothetical protein